MKPVLQQIEVTLAQMRKLEQTDRVIYAADLLQRSYDNIALICTDRGCGPEMVFPPLASAAAK